MTRPWTSGPDCPKCKMTGTGGTMIRGVDPVAPPGCVCQACGHGWEGTPEERERAEASDRAWDAECAREAEAEKERRVSDAAKAQARSLYEAAGRPVPEWAR
jgi:hypothetical protein